MDDAGRPARAAAFDIARDFQGGPAGDHERVAVHTWLEPERLVVELDAPFHGDPPPAAPVGRCARLWEHEVVELFLLGDDQRYTEIELGPHGHYLVLRLQGPRGLVDDGAPLQLTTHIAAGRWRARAMLGRSHLPEPIRAGNAYAIHGVGTRRRYLAAHPVPGPVPDFHRLECFVPLRLDAR